MAALALAALGAATLVQCRAPQGNAEARHDPVPDPWIVGFYTVGMGQPISELPWSNITHLHLCCAAPGPNGTLVENWLEPSSYALIRSMSREHHVKAILSIYVGNKSGDWSGNTAPGIIDTFVNSIAAYITEKGFDGVDLDWETDVDVVRYVNLITKLRSALPRRSISIDVYNPGALVTVAAECHSYLDQVNVMCYDMAKGPSFTWHNSALLQTGNSRLMTCDWRVGAFLAEGVPRTKLGIGIPAYGYVWQGATEPLRTGAVLLDKQWPYNQIIANPTWWNGGKNRRWDNEHKADYLSVAATNQFITYSGVRSIRKVVAWGKQEGVGGYMLLFLHQEYIPGAAGDARYPLSTALYNAVWKEPE